MDSVDRQAKINRIDEAGFKPSMFNSNADNRRSVADIIIFRKFQQSPLGKERQNRRGSR